MNATPITFYRLSIIAAVFVGLLMPVSDVYGQDLDGPIAYTGHGAMFDSDGREITPSLGFINEAQAFYRRALLERADPAVRERFAALEARLTEGRALQGQAQLVVESRLLDWLIKSVAPAEADRLRAKNNYMKLELQRKLPQAVDPAIPQRVEPFELPDAVERLLREQDLTLGDVGSTVFALSTTTGGQAYRDLCAANGVPVPPDWGTNGWVSRGLLNDVFISAGLQAEVFTFESASPEGMCIALPRFDNGDTIQLLGVICLGKVSSKACFWDNNKNGVKFFPQRGDVVPFEDFGGGSELTGDVCTSCHAGENPYVIHPGTPLGLPALAGLPLFSDNWYEPIVQPGWPQNPGPIAAPSVCAGCHVDGGSGGRFPAVSTELRGYCGSVLDNAIRLTMPPVAAGSQQNNAGVIALQDMCDQPPQVTPDVFRWAGAVWSHTGTACTGQSCPGWRRLDNNVRTSALTASNDKLYQLHHDGVIWESTGVPCSGDSCPGWRRLDNNPRTLTITAGGNNLYQLHNNGWIWKHTGVACSGSSCPGWQRLDNNPRTVAIAAADDKLYQLHRDGRIWVSTGAACSGNSCPGWRMLDNNPRTIAIAATDDRLFQLHHDGRIWEHTGVACSGQSCPGWRMLDNNPRTIDISANAGKLFQRHRNGLIWEFTGQACSGQSCPGWRRLDNNPRSAAVDGGLYQDHHDGRIWKSTGVACSGESCPGWRMLDNNPRTKFSLAADNANDTLYQLHAPKLYQLHDNGGIWQSIGDRCNGDSCGSWQKLDNNPRTIAITASGGKLYQLHDNGRIWQSTGEPCNDEGCPGWRMLDNNRRTQSIVSAGGQLYQLHDDGAIWRSNGTACQGNSCPGWTRLDNNSRTVEIVAGGGQLYQRHRDGRIWRFTGIACSGNSCPGWVLLDNNSRTRKIAAAGGKLYQLHDNGRIWESTGQACSGNSCPGWRMMDNNPSTVEIIGGGRELYQRHNDGRIWESTGQACSGNSCPGWRMKDNNPRTRALTAGGGILYQLHDNGAIWRSDGRPCAGNSCPGWQRLDNNPRTVAIEAAHE